MSACRVAVRLVTGAAERERETVSNSIEHSKRREGIPGVPLRIGASAVARVAGTGGEWLQHCAVSPEAVLVEGRKGCRAVLQRR